MTKQKKIMFVFGTRPEAIKMAPVIAELEKQPALEPLIVVTGQHRQMLDQVLKIFQITPQHDLQIMSRNQTLTDIAAKTLRGLETVISEEKPDMILVQGDTSTAFAAGLAAYYHRVPLGHVEAGLRTFDKWRPYPEEINRKLLSALADLHFAPTGTAVSNLIAEGVGRDGIYCTGNTVIDALFEVSDREFDLRAAGIRLDPDKKLVLVTVHRRENFGEPLERICRAIKRLAHDFSREAQVVLPVHKNPKVRDTVNHLLGGVRNIQLVEPQEYEPFVHLLKSSYIVLTDSGGVQEEAPSLGKPVLVMREKTERPEAVAFGTVKLVGSDEDKLAGLASGLLRDPAAYQAMSQAVNPYGDGRAARRTVQAILHYFGAVKQRPEEFSVEKVHN